MSKYGISQSSDSNKFALYLISQHSQNTNYFQSQCIALDERVRSNSGEKEKNALRSRECSVCFNDHKQHLISVVMYPFTLHKAPGLEVITVSR